MLRRYELTDCEWEKIKDLLPPEHTRKRGRPSKNNRIMLNGMIWIARSGAPWRDLPERYGPWESVYSRFRKWIDDGILDNIFRILSLDAELEDLSIDASIVKAHQHSAGAKKGGAPNAIGHSRGGTSTKIHAVVDSYGYPLYFMISEGQHSEMKFSIPVLQHVSLQGNTVLADKGYNDQSLMEYIQKQGGTFIIPPKSNSKVKRECDWWHYKERHVVENFFLKLKSYRRIATRYDKLACTYLGFLCLASIIIWLK